MPYKNPEDKKERSRTYYLENKRIILEKNKKWLENHPDEFSSYKKKWRQKNKERLRVGALHWREKNRERDRENKRLLKAKHKENWISLIKELNMDRCCQCGYSKSFAAIDFHHINPDDKDCDPNRLLYEKPTPKRIAELKKCIALCANCHRELHHKDKQFYVI